MKGILGEILNHGVNTRLYADDTFILQYDEYSATDVKFFLCAHLDKCLANYEISEVNFSQLEMPLINLACTNIYLLVL